MSRGVGRAREVGLRKKKGWGRDVCRQMWRGRKEKPQVLVLTLGSRLPGTFSVDSL